MKTSGITAPLQAITALDAIVLFFETIGVPKSPFFNIRITR